MKNKISGPEQKYVEPPEMREAGIPPLRKQLNYILITVAIIVFIVAAFAIYYIRK
ncbi:MAG: FeoB-associated Cys-rich membrane protein [Ginsengibacter sp.]